MVCSLLRIDEKIKCKGYPLSKRILIIWSKLLLWNLGWDKRKTLSIVDCTLCLLCAWRNGVNESWEICLNRNQSKIRVLFCLIMVRSKKFNLSPSRSISQDNVWLIILFYIILNYSLYYPKFYNDSSTRCATFYSHRFIRLTLNFEIRDNLKQLKFITSNIYRLTRTIENNLPIYICNQFFTTQHKSLKKFFKKEKIRLNKN